MAHEILFKASPSGLLIHTTTTIIDLIPDTNTPAIERDDITNVDGFSDNIFDLLANISEDKTSKDFFVKEIGKVFLQNS